MAAFPRPTALAVAFTMLLVVPGCRGAGPSSQTPAAAASVTRTPGAPAYRVRLTATDAGRTWSGHEQIAFTNTGTGALSRIWLRLWANGVGGCSPQAVRVTVTSGGTGGSLRRACTALEVALPTPLDPGARTSIGMDLSIVVPARNDRFGFHGGVANLGGALPILAIHDDSGWHLDPYVDIGESFYSVSGRYRVTLDVPADMRTPSTGSLVRARAGGVGVVRTFEAKRVREFMWSAGDLARTSGRVDGVHVNVWYLPATVGASQAASALGSARTSMRAFDTAFGLYPYPEVDVVLGGFTTFGGMEYPQIVLSIPNGRTVAHELSHQWWWGIVGSDEYAEPWLDESLATWSQALPWNPRTRCRRFEWPSATARITNDMGYWAAHPKEYGTIYLGGSCMLADLAHHIGLAPLERVLVNYARAHAFGVARGVDFRQLVSAEAAKVAPAFDLSAFWIRWRMG